MPSVARKHHPCNQHITPAIIPQGPAALPEALCSITLRVPMRGYADHALITGRGQTGAEAAAQWEGTRDALAAVLAPPPLPTSEARLAQLLACGLQKAVAKEDYGLVERLSKAVALVLSGAVEPTKRVQALAVRSQRDSSLWYTVEGQCCSCPDWQKHRADEAGYCCKHIAAAYFWRKIHNAVDVD